MKKDDIKRTMINGILNMLIGYQKSSSKSSLRKAITR